MTDETPEPALIIIKTLGAERIKLACGVGDHAIRFAKSAKRLPGRWFGALAPLCVEAGIPCPLSAFTWASPKGGMDGGHGEEHGDALAPRKGASAA